MTSAGAPRDLLGRIETAIGRVAEYASGLIVVVETAILLAGVSSRFVLKRPFTWSDELASILFLWLAMLGAVVAYRRLQHMRMSAIVNAMTPRKRAFLETLALATGVAFLMLVFWPALEYALDEIDIVTPALEIPNVWRAAALPVGIGMMILLGVIRAARTGHLADLGLSVALILSAGGALWLAYPLLMAMGNYKLLVFFVVLLGAMVLAGVPIAFAFGLAAFSYLALTTRTPITVVVSRMDEGMSHFIQLSVPLFVFLGRLIEITGMARAMVDCLSSLIGHLRGGLRYVLLCAMYLVSGISGSKAAGMAAVAPVLFAKMKKRGANGGDLVALLSASGAMSETIPPSLGLITIGTVANVSIAALFAGGLVPALVLAFALCAIVWWRSRDEDISGGQKASLGIVRKTALIALPGMALPFLIRAAVVEGVGTATEAATIGILYSLLYGVIAAAVFGARVEWQRLWPIIVDTAALSGAILFIIGAATAMTWALTQSGFSRELAKAMAGLPGGAAGFMAISIVAFVILGSVLEGIPAIVLLGPLLFPIARQLGIHEVHYAMVVILAAGIGQFAPPLGAGYSAACAIGRADPAEGSKIWPYLIALLAGVVVIASVPWLTIGLL